MTDYEALRAMYDKAGIRYAIGDATMANFYRDKGVMDKAIEVQVSGDESVNGYVGFASHHTFDADGNLLNVYIWE